MGETQENKNNDLENDLKSVANETVEDEKNEIVEENPVQSNENNNLVQKKGKSTKKIIPICIVGLLVLVGAMIAFINYNKHQEILAQQQAEKEKIEEYNTHIENLNLLYASSLSGASTAESVCVLTCNVWQDAIYGDPSDETQKYVSGATDFNEALQRVYDDEEIQEKLSEVTTAKEESDKYIQNLQSCPEELSKAYDIALQVNTTFNALADLALNPNGSYNTYSQSEKEKVDAFVSTYTMLKAVIPSKKEVPMYDEKGNNVEDQFGFDIYLNQLSDKLPDTVDDSGAAIMGIYKDSATICGHQGEVSYFAYSEVIRAISWEIEAVDDNSVDDIVNKLREKYGEENIQDDTSYSWSDNLACSVLLTITDEKVKINWLSAL